MSDEETVKLQVMISHLADDLKITYSLSGLGLSMISIGVKHIQIIVRKSDCFWIFTVSNFSLPCCFFDLVGYAGQTFRINYFSFFCLFH